jgi:RND family efflux transporter MFP subunit
MPHRRRGGSSQGSAAGVAFVSVSPESVAITSEWIATLDGTVNAQIRPQVSGYLVQRRYRLGAFVRKGDALFEIDRRPFETALNQATARLAESQAQMAKAERDLARDTPLAEQRAIAQSQLDNDVSARDAAQASVSSSKAAVEAARLNLGFTRVTSLIDGVAAIASAQIGDLVGPSTLLTTVSQVNPIKVNFPISEQEYLAIAPEVGTPAAAAKLWQAGGGLTLLLADGTTHQHHGSVLAVDRDVDPKMGTIRVSAVFPNPGNILRPGQYGRVRARTAVRQNALLVPQRAVSELQNGFQLRVLTPDNKVTVRSVTLGSRVGSRWIVEKGLQPNDRVVVDAPSLKDGIVVSPHPAAATTEAP